MRRSVQAAAATLVILWAAAVGASVQKDFMRLWEARAEGYTLQRPAIEERTAKDAAQAVQSIKTGQPSAGQELGLALRSTRELSTLYGRYQTLWVLREHMGSKPSEALSEAWMQAQIGILRTKIADTDLAEKQIRQSVPGRDISLLEWVGAIEKLAQDRGYIEGATAELTLIDDNLHSYYVARSEEHEKAVRLRAAILTAIAISLASQQRESSDFGVRTVSEGSTLCPDGSYVGGPTCNLAPNGKYVGGNPHITSRGDYVGGNVQMAPNGQYVGGSGKMTICPDGSYVSGTCHMTPQGRYVGD